jgi:hypothetical protein
MFVDAGLVQHFLKRLVALRPAEVLRRLVEDHVLEQMRGAGVARRLVPRADVVDDHEREDGAGVVRHQQDGHVVRFEPVLRHAGVRLDFLDVRREGLSGYGDEKDGDESEAAHTPNSKRSSAFILHRSSFFFIHSKTR